MNRIFFFSSFLSPLSHIWQIPGKIMSLRLNKPNIYIPLYVPLFLIYYMKTGRSVSDQPEKNLIHNKCRNPAGDLLDLVKTPQTSTIGQPTPLQAVQSTDRKPPETQAPPDIRQPEAPHSAQWQRSHPVC